MDKTKARSAASRERNVGGDGGAGRASSAPTPAPAAPAVMVVDARRPLQQVGVLLFGTWAWLTVAVLAPAVWLTALLLPNLTWRWRAMHTIARVIFRLTGTPLVVVGLDNLRPDGSVLTSNHASYLDVLALVAALPRPVAFVAKAELRGSWALRVMLDRLGTCFVERFNRKQGLGDYRRIALAAREGRTPLFFPEGTFQRPPGLLPFRMGAFACAVETSLPVVPVVVRGTRAMLPSGTSLPRPGAVCVTIAPPVAPAPDAEGWNAAVALRDRVRDIMLEIAGEPDARTADPFPLVAAALPPAASDN